MIRYISKERENKLFFCWLLRVTKKKHLVDYDGLFIYDGDPWWLIFRVNDPSRVTNFLKDTNIKSEIFKTFMLFRKKFVSSKPVNEDLKKNELEVTSCVKENFDIFGLV